jgi:predicted DNA-binding WGR domain protein
VDWEHDAAELLANPPPPTEEEKKKAEKAKKEEHPVDREFDLWETSEVHAVDTEDGGKDIFDVTLTKVDVHHGLYGINNFYRMQVIHNKVKDLYFLWNKWGRIGDTGQYQRTPFPSAAAACEEFRKIFRSKTGNAWEERAEFDKKPKKYHLVKVDTEREQNIANLLKPFDIELEDDVDPTKKTGAETSKYPASKLPLPLQHAIKALTDSTMLTQAMKTGARLSSLFCVTAASHLT